MAYGFSVFWLPLSRAIGVTADQGVPRHDALAGAFHHDLRLAQSPAWAGCTRCSSSCWASRPRPGAAGLNDPGRARPASSPRSAGAAVSCSAPSASHASALAVVAWLRRDRRCRSRPRLHLAGVDAGEMVSRPPRHGDRHGDHGLWRRRHDRRSARRPLDEFLQDPDLGRRVGNLPDHGRHLFRLHDDWRLPLSASARGMASRRLDLAGQGERDDLAAQRAT